MTDLPEYKAYREAWGLHSRLAGLVQSRRVARLTREASDRMARRFQRFAKRIVEVAE